MIKTFVKKPIEVQAVQWTGDNYSEICNFIGYYPALLYNGMSGPFLVVGTYSNHNYVSTGDWIVHGDNGEFCPTNMIFLNKLMKRFDYE